MRFLQALFSTLILVACSTAPATRDQSAVQNAPTTPPVEFLLTASATDFQTHRPPYPARFRAVHSGYVVTAEGTRQYLICGEFLPSPENSDSKVAWTSFATIKTSGYEQWLGETTFCKRRSVTWDKGDLSSALQTRLDSLQSP